MLHIAAVLAAALLFGTTGTAQALGPEGTTPLSIGVMRMVIGGTGLALLAFLLARRHARRRTATAVRPAPGIRPLSLMVLTGAEIAVSYMDIGKAQVPLLLVMMAVKFFTVVLYFMHLKYDNVLFKRLFYSGLFLALFVYIVALLTFHFFE